MLPGQDHMESRTLSGLAGGIYIPVVVLDDFLTHGQTDAGSRIFGPAVQALKDAEDLIGMYLVESDAIVPNLDMIVGAFGDGGYDNDRFDVGTRIFQGIGQQVAKDLTHLKRYGVYGWQIFELEFRPFLFDQQFEFGLHIFHDRLQADGRAPTMRELASDTGVTLRQVEHLVAASRTARAFDDVQTAPPCRPTNAFSAAAEFM